MKEKRLPAQDSNKSDLRNDPNQWKEGVIAGRNALMEALKSGTALEKIFVIRGEVEGSLVRILSLAKEKGIPIGYVDRVKLEFLCGNKNHQGVAAYTASKEYSTLEDVLELAREKGEPPFLVLAAEIEDPHNLGAIIRTCEAAGVHGLVITKHQSAGITPAVTKASAGAVFHLPIVKVSSMPAAIDQLKEQNVWVYGTDASATQSVYETDFSGGVAIAIGSEGRGLGELTRKKCDFLVSLPMKGKVTSLNASVAAGLLIYEVVRQRDGASRGANGAKR